MDMEATKSENEDENDDNLFYINSLQEQALSEAVDTFDKIEKKIDNSVAKWKLNFQEEKQRIITELGLNNVTKRLTKGGNDTPLKKCNIKIKYLQRVLDKIQYEGWVEIKKDFENTLKYNGNILQYDITSGTDTNVNDKYDSDEESIETDMGMSSEGSVNSEIEADNHLVATRPFTDIRPGITFNHVNKKHAFNTKKSSEEGTSKSSVEGGDSEVNKDQSVIFSSDEVHEHSVQRISSFRRSPPPHSLGLCTVRNTSESTDTKLSNKPAANWMRRAESYLPKNFHDRIANRSENFNNTHREKIANPSVPKQKTINASTDAFEDPNSANRAAGTSKQRSAATKTREAASLVKETGPTDQYKIRQHKPEHSREQISGRSAFDGENENRVSINTPPVSVRQVRTHLKDFGSMRLKTREETVMPFPELRNQLASPNPTFLGIRKERTHSAMGIEEIQTRDVSRAFSYIEIAKHKHKTVDRNWTDILLFSDYYLVTIQKKQHGIGTNEWLNKYSKQTGDILTWLSLPEAGRMCRINKRNGLVGVLQIGRKFRCIAVVKTTGNSISETEETLELLYRINVQETYFAIAAFGQFKSANEPNMQMKFAAVSSAERNGIALEEVYTCYAQPLSMKKVSGVKTYDCIKSVVIRNNGINSIDTIGGDKIVVSMENKVVCVNTSGRSLWEVPMQARVTDICCLGNSIFVCLPDKGRLLKLENQNCQGVMTHSNVLSDEELKPNQVSVCEQSLLIREFILNEFRSDVVIRIIRF